MGDTSQYGRDHNPVRGGNRNGRYLEGPVSKPPDDGANIGSQVPLNFLRHSEAPAATASHSVGKNA
jgi:hypothetical protein